MAGVSLRRLGRGERRPVLEVFDGMSPRSRLRRFHSPKPRLRDEELDQLVDVGCCGREAVAAVEVATGRAIGIARFVRDVADRSTAEVAFEVVDEWQGRGVGRRLMRELSALARRQGVARVRADVAAGNEPAFALLRGAGDVVSTTSEDGVFDVLVELHERPRWQVPAEQPDGSVLWVLPAA
jgi:RimJ/RimL family protein N-acetyltransferase